MDVQTEMIQPGWTVLAKDGEEVGEVGDIENHTVIVKKKGLLGTKTFRIPMRAVTDVETGRVELSMSKEEVEASR